MDFARIVVIILYAAGLVLPVLGAFLLVRRANQTIRVQEAGLVTSARLFDEWLEEASHYELAGSRNEKVNRRRNEVNEKYDALFTAEGLITPNGLNADPTGDRAVIRALRFAAKGNGGNAMIVGIGLVASTIASVWALYLPAA